MDEGLVGLQMLPPAWLAAGLFFHILCMFFRGARHLPIFWSGFLTIGVLGMAVKRCLWGYGFAQKPTRTVLDRGIPCVAWSMLDLFLGNPEAARPTNNQTKIASYGTRQRYAYRSGRATHTGHSALGFHHQ